MHEDIELAIESPGGIIDCRLEPQMSDMDELFFSATILYPNMVDGINRSEIFCHDLWADASGSYSFRDTDNVIHPKIIKLEGRLSQAITTTMSKR